MQTRTTDNAKRLEKRAMALSARHLPDFRGVGPAASNLWSGLRLELGGPGALTRALGCLTGSSIDGRKLVEVSQSTCICRFKHVRQGKNRGYESASLELMA